MQDPSEFVADSVKAYTERGVDGIAEFWHPDVVYEEDPLWPGAAEFHGRPAVAARFREYEEQLGVGPATTERIVERPDHVVIIFRHVGVTPGAGVPYEHRWAWVVEMRDGKAVHIRAYFDPDQALGTTESESS